jgi:MFS family permease
VSESERRAPQNLGEPERQKLARNLGELLQELRVGQAGVQILFGFLLSVIFSERYARATGFERGVHFAAVLFAAAATLLLTAPAAWHRLLFRAGRRPEIIRAANGFALSGLVCLAAAMTATVTLIADLVLGPRAGVVVGGVAGLAFLVLWFAVPIRKRLRPRPPSATSAGPPSSADGSD